MRRLSIAMMIVTPLLLLAACGNDSDKKEAVATPDAAAFVKAQPPPTQSSPPPAPAENTASVPLRQTPLGLVGPGSAAPGAPPPGAAALPPQEPEDAPPSEGEVRMLYEGIMYTYAFDACGLPLIGERARQDIEQRIEICPNPPLRKDAFRTVYHRAMEVAQQDADKLRASAGHACPDKHEFLRRVMSHASELTFDESKPPDCSVLSPPPPGAPPADPAASASDPSRAGKPF